MKMTLPLWFDQNSGSFPAGLIFAGPTYLSPTLSFEEGKAYNLLLFRVPIKAQYQSRLEVKSDDESLLTDTN